MNADACRDLLTDAWIGITKHITCWTVDFDAIDNMEDDEVLQWISLILSGTCSLGYTVNNDVVTPVLLEFE